MILFDQFYKRFGIRRTSQLIRPLLAGMNDIVLPRGSIFHFMGNSPIDSGPDARQPEFNQIVKPILVSHVMTQTVSLGNPRPAITSSQALTSQWFQKNRRYKKLINFDTGSRDETIMIVFNYAFLWRMYKYPRSLLANLNQWHNIAETVWGKVGSLASTSHRNQFLTLTLPRTLPSLIDLQTAEQNTMTPRTVKRFNSHESLLILEIWKWLGENRQNSMLSHIPADRLGRVNILIEEAGRFAVLNLGLLNSWRVATASELEANPQANQHGLEPKIIQKYFLKLLMTTMEVRTAAAPEIEVQSGAEEDPMIATPSEPANVVLDENGTAKVQVPYKDPMVQAGKSTSVDADHMDIIGMHEELFKDTVKQHVDEATFAAAMALPEERGADIKRNAELEKQLDADLERLEHIANLAIPDEEQPQDVIVEAPVVLPPDQAVMKIADRLAQDGMLSAGEHRRYQNLSQAYKRIVAPDGQSTLESFVKVAKEDVHIPESPSVVDIKTVTDKTMLKSSLLTFDSDYIKKVMQKDVAAMVLNLQQAGLCLTDYAVEDVDDIMGQYRIYTARVTPIDGASSTLRFRLPILNEDGTFTSNGVKYRVRKQRGDLPIRKIAPDRVALTSYYGKVFVSRSTKKVNDYGQWITNNIMSMGLDRENLFVTDMHTGDVFDNLFAAPKLYSTLAMSFRSFEVEPTHYPRTTGVLKLHFSFDHTERVKLVGESVLKKWEKDGSVICGKDQHERPLLMDRTGAIYVIMEGPVVGGMVLQNPLVGIGTMESLLNLPPEKAPVEFAQVKILGRDIPLGVVLGYELGLTKLMKLLRVEPRRVPAGMRVGLAWDEYGIVFQDETYVFKRTDSFATMVLAGFNEYHRHMRLYPVHEFDKRGVYLNVLESGGASQRYLREIDLQYQLFIDPITKELLEDMKEPTDYQGLLMRSAAMLQNDNHPDELDSKWQRIKGYERMAGAVYSEIVRSIRVHNGKIGKSRAPIDLNPFQVWKNITQDPAKVQISEINPIQNLKEIEAVTYAGTGGRGGRSMTKATRVYHKNDMGTISEATVDSSDVAINTYTSADPQFTSLRGLSKQYDFEKQGATPLLSSSALLGAGLDRDDPKRTNFTSIQNSHLLACKGYQPAAVRTGYEQVIAHRTGDLFAMTAKQAGKVVSVNEHGIVVQYEDGEVKGFELGRRFGDAAGLVVPHLVKTHMKAGQEFKPGELICYNDGFFTKDPLNPNGVVMKNTITVKTVLMEAMSTLEDSSAISKEAAELLTAKLTKTRTIVVNFDQQIHKLLKTGTIVESEDILCVIEDAVTAGNRLFDEASLDTLRILSAQTPKAKSKGTIERVEVFYHGELEDMSESLRALASESDKLLLKKSRAVGHKGYTGSVDEGYRVDGNPLLLDTAAIKIYITGDVAVGIGDKGVFGNQLKTVFGEIMEHDLLTESGVKVDAVFGATSIANRIVSSPDIIGTTTTLLKVIARKAAEIYRGGSYTPATEDITEASMSAQQVHLSYVPAPGESEYPPEYPGV